MIDQEPNEKFDDEYEEERYWYALYTRSRHEKKIELRLTMKGIDCYAPLHKVIRQWSDRKKIVEEPLFRNYIFVYGTKQEYRFAVSETGVVRGVTTNGRPAIIQDREIEAIRQFVASGVPLEIDDTPFEPTVGEWVEVMSGPLQGYIGEVMIVKGNKRLALRLDVLGATIHADIAPFIVQPYTEPKDE